MGQKVQIKFIKAQKDYLAGDQIDILPCIFFRQNSGYV